MKQWFSSAFCVAAELDGFQVSSENFCELRNEKGKKINRDSKKLEEKYYLENVLSAQPMSELEVISARKIGEYKESQSFAIERYRMEKCLAIKDIQEEDVFFWNRGMLESQIHNFEILLADQDQMSTYESADKARVRRDKKHPTVRRELFELIVSELGICKITGVGAFSNKEAKSLLEKIYKNKQRFSLIGVHAQKSWAVTIKATVLVNKLLRELLNLRTEPSRARVEGGTQIRVYSVTEDSICAMKTLHKRRNG